MNCHGDVSDKIQFTEKTIKASLIGNGLGYLSYKPVACSLIIIKCLLLVYLQESKLVFDKGITFSNLDFHSKTEVVRDLLQGAVVQILQGRQRFAVHNDGKMNFEGLICQKLKNSVVRCA